MPDLFLPLLRLLPLAAGSDLQIYAVNGRMGQAIPPCHSDKDTYIAVQQGILRLICEDSERLLQPHESEFLPAGTEFRVEAMTDTRARLVLPAMAKLSFARPKGPSALPSPLQAWEPRTDLPQEFA